MDEQQALQALDRINDEIAGIPEVGAEGMIDAAPAGPADELCDTYRDVRPFLEGALWIVERIPVYGKKIANAIRFLMKVADTACPS